MAAIEAGYQMDEIEQAAYEYTKSIDDGERVIVGVNRFTVDGEPEPEVFPIDPELQRTPGRAGASGSGRDRDQAAVEAALADVRGRGARHPEPAAADEGGASPPTPRSAR